MRRTRSLPDASALQRLQRDRAEETFAAHPSPARFDPVLISRDLRLLPSRLPNVEGWKVFDHPTLPGANPVIDTMGEAARPRRLSPGGIRLEALRVAGDRVRFLVVGDAGLEGPGADQVASAMKEAACERPTHFTLHVGDMIYPHGPLGRDDARFQERVLDRYSGDRPLLLVLGNHEYGDDTGAASPESIPKLAQSARAKGIDCQFPARYYALPVQVDGGGRPGAAFSADLFVLDTSTLCFDAGQRRWIEGALADSRADRKIVVGHHPYRSDGLHRDSAYLRAVLLPLMQTHGVSAYVSGHEHDLQLHTGEVPAQLVTGSGAETRETGPSKGASFSASQLGFAAIEIDRGSMELALRTLDGAGRLDPAPLALRRVDRR